jgi:NDP-sugar pyrophosphorylase family protein
MTNLSSVTAAILAGGLGTRLRSVVADRPKVLAEVNGRPFLAYLLEQVAAAGVKKVILCTGYLGEQIEAAFGPNYAGLQLSYSPETTPLGTGGALRLALPLITSDSVLVLNGDSYCQVDLPAFYAWYQQQAVRAALVLTHLADTSRSGWVQLENGRVIEFVEKKGGGSPGWVNAGIYLVSRSMLKTIPPEQMVSIERDIFPAWLQVGLGGFQSKGLFIDIGIPESYTLAAKVLAKLA